MATAFMNLARLGRAGIVLAQHGVRFVPRGMKVPFVLKLARVLTWPVSLITAPFRMGQSKAKRVGRALTSLGPSYIKLGQFMATRADVIGAELADDLGQLRDKLPAFPMSEARQTIEQELGGALEDHFTEFGPPVAAASIAQVHKARINDKRTDLTQVAVKILRPGIEKRFRRDLDSYYFVASLVERFHKPSRRLMPVAVVDNLKRTTELEMDLRLEAAAISEMAENIAGDEENLRVPQVDWNRTSRRVLTLEWIEGTPINDHAALAAQGFDQRELGQTILRAFLKHAMRDGFFHADMHQGNLLVDKDGGIIAVDFGIMGRLGQKERRFLAEILYGLTTRDYMRASRAHFEAGYVPPHHSVEVFAQALRAIGEPINGRTADEISMADLLGQLFAYTDVFDMETRPELILLQKSMVIVEGVARSLDPELNLWSAAEPVAREWIEANLGAVGALKDAREGAGDMGRFLAGVPGVLAQAETTAQALAQMARGGIALDDATIVKLAAEQSRQDRGSRVALWLGALSLAVIATSFWLAG